MSIDLAVVLHVFVWTVQSATVTAVLSFYS
jgi:hypothetical protein